MASYYVNNNKQANGDYEVHAYGCTYFPSSNTYLGEHSGCSTAVTKANQTHYPANGCYWCCRLCHTS